MANCSNSASTSVRPASASLGLPLRAPAHEAGLPIAIVNRGRTRGDDLAELKIEADLGATLTEGVAASVGNGASSEPDVAHGFGGRR
jgi:hypothetical protein